MKHKDKSPGGLADKSRPMDFDHTQLARGRRVEMEHTDDPSLAQEIAMDHLTEDPDYYKKLSQIEKQAYGVKMSGLRTKLIRLAHQKPELRAELLPLLRGHGHAKTARITEQKVFLSGVMPESIATKGAYAYIEVKGNTFPLKSELSRAGLRWSPANQSWGLSVNSQLEGFRRYDQIAPVIAKAFRTLGPIVEQFNREVDERNKARVPATPRTIRDIQHRIDSISRRNDFLENAGLHLEHTNKGPLAPENILYITGETLPLRAVFRKFGWKWWPEKRAWWLPLSDWRIVERPFLAAIGPLVPQRPVTPETPAAVGGTQIPWSRGPVWLRNDYHQDEAEDTGISFTAAGPNSVDVETTYLFREYEHGSRRMSNAEGLKIYLRYIQGGGYSKA